MAGNSFEITGSADVQRILDEIAPKHARNLMRATIHGVASQIAKDASSNAPVYQGILKKSIAAKRKKSPPDAPVSDVYVTHGNNAKHDAFYWRFVEYGTKNSPEQPFIRPAADRARADFDKVIADQFGQKLEKALAREARKKKK